MSSILQKLFKTHSWKFVKILKLSCFGEESTRHSLHFHSLLDLDFLPSLSMHFVRNDLLHVPLHTSPTPSIDWSHIPQITGIFNNYLILIKWNKPYMWNCNTHTVWKYQLLRVDALSRRLITVMCPLQPS